MSKVLELKDICKRFGDVVALDSISFDVSRGEWISVMGPSGSGKSTLVNILSLMDEPTSGTYLLGGDDASRLNADDTLKFRREKIGLIFQQFHLVPYLSALENVMIAQYYHSSVDEDDAKKALERVGLGHRLDHRPSQLSGGEQQRLCIARSLINDPEILIADEPTGNLDEANERVVLELFKQLRNEGKTILLITHNPDLGEFGDKIVYLKHGKLENIDVISDERRVKADAKIGAIK
ncbi:ABC transporter ATP-binding protein [Campylobacter sp. faydin G-24]|uniref:ABC transporter ATP-binding protein n=1 Tax=Campylobacter anatolicus TaxID=2829105 RepID=A0ABS5HGD9_9BACT|nr:ABC transporter ATP-binding protein [Campylobacter anatolicus]MBR8463344.1 ABC transporter ATP-binding protein [Campylobacter anatolicus]